jgi:hypothetical protein
VAGPHTPHTQTPTTRVSVPGTPFIPAYSPSTTPSRLHPTSTLPPPYLRAHPSHHMPLSMKPTLAASRASALRTPAVSRSAAARRAVVVRAAEGPEGALAWRPNCVRMWLGTARLSPRPPPRPPPPLLAPSRPHPINTHATGGGGGASRREVFPAQSTTRHPPPSGALNTHIP